MKECIIDSSIVRYDDDHFKFVESQYGDHLEYIGTGGFVPQPVPLLSMRSMFSRSKVTELDLSSWDTSEVTTMYEAFCDCENLERIIGIEKFDTSKCTNFTAMFLCCESLKELDLKNWNVSNGRLFECTFGENYSLELLEISTWDMSNAVEICWMLDMCKSLKKVDVSKWNVSKVTDMRMFAHGCKSLERIDIDNWNISSVEKLTGAFANCPCFNLKQIASWGLESYKAQQLLEQEDLQGNMSLF